MQLQLDGGLVQLELRLCKPKYSEKIHRHFNQIKCNLLCFVSNCHISLFCIQVTVYMGVICILYFVMMFCSSAVAFIGHGWFLRFSSDTPIEWFILKDSIASSNMCKCFRYLYALMNYIVIYFYKKIFRIALFLV